MPHILRLPLALAVAGGMLRERAHDWTMSLVPLLLGDNQPGLLKFSLQEDDAFAINYEPSIEERVISSSLHLLLMKKQYGVVALFHHCAVFPQLTRVPCAVFEAIAPAITVHTRFDHLGGAIEEQMPPVLTITPARVPGDGRRDGLEDNAGDAGQMGEDRAEVEEGDHSVLLLHQQQVQRRGDHALLNGGLVLNGKRVVLLH